MVGIHQIFNCVEGDDGDPQGEATAWLDLGDIQLASGQADAARRCWERSRALLAEIPGADLSGASDRLGNIGCS